MWKLVNCAKRPTHLEETHSIDLSSTSPIETYDKPILDSGYEDNAFWSILTDTVVYYGEDNLSSLIFDIDKLYTTVDQTHITDPKDLYFSAEGMAQALNF